MRSTRLKRKGFSDRRLAHLWKTTEHEVRKQRHALGIRPVYKRVDTCAAEFETGTAYMYSTYDEEDEARAHEPQQDHGAGRRAEPHRPGHRVRLLLRARGARAARGRLRDHHGQLQPRDRLDRLRHLGPPLLRAAHARGRARDRRQGKARGRDRAVRRADAAQARARPRGRRRADHRHLARLHRPRRGPRALPADAAQAEAPAAAQPHRAHARGGARGREGNRLPGGGAPLVRARRARDGDRARRERPGALHAARR